MLNTKIDRNAIRKSLRQALRPSPTANYGKLTWPEIVYNRLTTMAIKSTVNPVKMPEKQAICLEMWSKGWGRETIARGCHITLRQVDRRISAALDYFIDRIPYNLLVKIPLETPQVIITSGCPNCHGDLQWQGEYDCYYCLACARRYNRDINPTSI